METREVHIIMDIIEILITVLANDKATAQKSIDRALRRLRKVCAAPSVDPIGPLVEVIDAILANDHEKLIQVRNRITGD